MKKKLVELKGLELISYLESQPEIIDFLRPVNTHKKGLSSYKKVISKPMCLFTIKEKLSEGLYTSFSDLLSDVNLIWSNCRKFNEANSVIITQPIVQNAIKLEKRLKSYLSDHQELPLKRKDPAEASDPPSKNSDVLILKYITRDQMKELKERIAESSIDIQSNVVNLVKKRCSRSITQVEDRLILSLERLNYKTFQDIKLLLDSPSDI